MFMCKQDDCCVWPAVVWSVTCARRQKLMLRVLSGPIPDSRLSLESTPTGVPIIVI